jgi:hypothetical protein
MSTILRALRKFEEDIPLEASSPAIESLVVDELRSRILAEERAANEADRERRGSARPPFVVAVTTLVVMLAVGVGVGLDSFAPTSDSLLKPADEINTPRDDPSDPLLDQDSAGSVAASSLEVDTGTDRIDEGLGPARPLAVIRSAAGGSVAEHRNSHGASELSILGTAWHPRSDRRTATVRLIKTGETRTLREGDAIDGLVLKEISPSAVVFLSGAVEIRLRLGRSE